MSDEHYNHYGLTAYGARDLDRRDRVERGIPSDIQHVLKIIDECVEKLKGDKELDLHGLGMLDGMLVIQSVANGNPWPL